MQNEVRSVMTREVVVAEPATTFLELAALMNRSGVSAVPVVDPERHVLGVVSEGDLILREAHPSSEDRRRWLSLLEWSHTEATRRLAEELEKSSGRTAAELMTSPAVTVGEDASLQQAAYLMRTARIKRVVVTDTDGRLAGIVSRSDLLKAFLRGDDAILRDVLSVLTHFDPPVHGLDVEVKAGTALLRGRLAPGADADAIVAAVESVPGVIEVASALTPEHAATSG